MVWKVERIHENMRRQNVWKGKQQWELEGGGGGGGGGRVFLYVVTLVCHLEGHHFPAFLVYRIKAKY